MYRAFVLDCTAPHGLLRDSGDGTTHPAMCGVARSCGTDSDPSHPHARRIHALLIHRRLGVRRSSDRSFHRLGEHGCSHVNELVILFVCFFLRVEVGLTGVIAAHTSTTRVICWAPLRLCLPASHRGTALARTPGICLA